MLTELKARISSYKPSKGEKGIKLFQKFLFEPVRFEGSICVIGGSFEYIFKNPSK